MSVHLSVHHSWRRLAEEMGRVDRMEGGAMGRGRFSTRLKGGGGGDREGAQEGGGQWGGGFNNNNNNKFALIERYIRS